MPKILDLGIAEARFVSPAVDGLHADAGRVSARRAT
jgi:hypothetical protein